MKKNRQNTGMKKTMKNGVVMLMTITTETTLKQVRMKPRNISGILVSDASTSFENRFSIRPIGVDSKNCIPQ